MYVYTYIFPSSSIQYIWNILILEDLNSHPDWLPGGVPLWLHQLFNYEAAWDGGATALTPASRSRLMREDERLSPRAAGSSGRCPQFLGLRWKSPHDQLYFAGLGPGWHTVTIRLGQLHKNDCHRKMMSFIERIYFYPWITFASSQPTVVSEEQTGAKQLFPEP